MCSSLPSSINPTIMTLWLVDIDAIDKKIVIYVSWLQRYDIGYFLILVTNKVDIVIKFYALYAHRWCYLVTTIISPTHSTNTLIYTMYMNVLVVYACMGWWGRGEVGRWFLSLNNTTGVYEAYKKVYCVKAMCHGNDT